jgi:putative hydrolase of the HAD superfamily
MHIFDDSTMKGYKHIFFDLDQTLWDFKSNSREALTEIYHEFELGRYYSDPDQLNRLYHYHNNLLWESYRYGKLDKDTLRILRFKRALKDVNIEDEELAGAIAGIYLELISAKTILFPFAMEILEYLIQKYPLYILTNGFRETQFNKLKNSGLLPYFKCIFTSETIGYSKPHPKIFRWAVSSVNALKRDCLMIGDDFDADILGAKRFGIDQVYFNPDHEQYEGRPSYEISSLIQLKDIL